MKLRYQPFLFVLCLVFATTSCKKYLDTKSNQNLSTPSSYNDMEAILNNSVINKGTQFLNGMTDEYFFRYTDFLNRTEQVQQGYVWDGKLNDYYDWGSQYAAVFNANTVLLNLDLIGAGDQVRYNRIKGAALFMRTQALWRVAQLFSMPYDGTTAATDLGIPLRLNANIDEVSTRVTIKTTYDQFINDLKQAADLLPAAAPTTLILKTFPTKAAALGLLARIYLQIGDYSKAREIATAALAIHAELVDFSDPTWVMPAVSPSMVKFNPEIIFYSITEDAPNSSSAARIDTTLYRSYDDNDLRKTAYFRRNSDGTYRFKGSYGGDLFSLFCGIATDELYLIRAECAARAGATNEALQDLNTLLNKRWKAGTFTDRTASSADQALNLILQERQKEFIYREIRWTDIRRYSKEPGREVTLLRNLNGQNVSLSPNDPRYILLIPKEVLAMVNIPQNPR